VRGHKRVIYESCIGMVSHGDPYSMRGHIHRHTIRLLRIMVSGSPAVVGYIKAKGHETVIYGSPRGWFHMVIPTP